MNAQTFDHEEEEYLENSEELSSAIAVTETQVGMRLDVFVTGVLAGATRAEAQRLIEMPDAESAGVHVNQKRTKSNYRLRDGDIVTIERPLAVPTRVEAEDIPLPILYEDSDLLVIDKPRGMVVHPAPGSPTGTLVNAVLAHAKDLSGVGGELRPGIVHRLDKDTGGLLMVAKNDMAHHSLQAQIQARTAERRYMALVWGSPTFADAKVEGAIGRHPTDRKKMAVVTDPRFNSRSAITELTVRERFGDIFTLLEAKLQTGRTHQIRVHCAYIKLPIVGDPIYGGQRKLPGNSFPSVESQEIEAAIHALDGQALHAYSLAFDHPRTGERLHFSVPLAPEMQKLLDLLRA